MEVDVAFWVGDDGGIATANDSKKNVFTGGVFGADGEFYEDIFGVAKRGNFVLAKKFDDIHVEEDFVAEVEIHLDSLSGHGGAEDV